MKMVANVLAVIGILLVVYSVFGRFYGVPAIGAGIIESYARSGLIMANSLILIAILIKLKDK